MLNFFRLLIKVITFTVFLLLLVVAVVFCVNNSQNVVLSLKPFPYEIETRLFLIVVIAFLLGLLCGFFSLVISLIRSQIDNWINRSKIKKLQNKLFEK